MQNITYYKKKYGNKGPYVSVIKNLSIKLNLRSG